ncbi:MAG TPA: PaaI family thioesterase [Polyangiales bacterium]
MDQAEIAALLNQNKDGWSSTMGMSFVSASADAVEAEWTVGKQHLQPYGIVHGGVHCGVIETVCSVGAAISATQRGHKGGVVGLENTTSFIRAVREGAKLRAKATPVTRGRTTQVWQAEVRDEQERLVATGRVRLLCVETGAPLG